MRQGQSGAGRGGASPAPYMCWGEREGGEAHNISPLRRPAVTHKYLDKLFPVGLSGAQSVMDTGDGISTPGLDDE